MSALLTIEQLAEALNVSTSWVQQKGASGEIPSIKVGKYRRFELDAVLAKLKDDEDGKAA